MKPLKTLTRIGFVLLIAVAAALIARAVFNVTEGRALARTLAGLKAEGIPLNAKDLAPPCPDADNAARLWRAAENLLTVMDPQDRPLLIRVWADFSAGKPMAPADKTAMKDLVLRNQKAFDLMTAMSDKPCFLYRDPSLPLMEAQIPNALKMIQATHALVLAAYLSADEGDVTTASDRVVSGLKFAPMVSDEGTLISFLIAVADMRTLAYFLGDIFQDKALDEAALLELIDELDPSPWLGRLAGAIRGERTGFIEAGEYARWGSLKDIESLFGERSFLKNIGVWLIRPFLKRDIRKALPIYRDLEAQTQLPYYESRSFLRSRGQQLMKRPWYAFLSKAMIANFEYAFMKEAALEAVLLVSRTGLACRLHKSRSGQYPDTLEALVPGILKEVPIDPFTGKPLVYRHEGEGFIVYSLGSNEKDDSGLSTFNFSRLVMGKDDDWAWRDDK